MQHDNNLFKSNISVSGLSCPSAGYMLPDPNNLCFVWFCVSPGQAPIKRPCPKGVRVPSWWEGGELAMCNIVNIVKHGGEPVCLRCDADDIRPDDSKCLKWAPFFKLMFSQHSFDCISFKLRCFCFELRFYSLNR